MTIQVCCVLCPCVWRCTAAGEQEMSHRSGLRAETYEKNIDRKATGKHEGLLLWEDLSEDFFGQKGRI